MNSLKLQSLITAADKIVADREKDASNIFNTQTKSDDIYNILEIDIQNPEQSYSLYYNNIQNFLNTYLPKNTEVSKVIRNLINTLLSHHERENIKYGKRGADGRMAKTQDMENLIDIFVEWSKSPNDYYKLALILLQKNKDLKYIPKDRKINDYI
ncbi:hypothetical protein N9251_02460 [Gammaproteobacteria bacterium]|nr:hypothetical protein [Gammaproteobacteria bacterium]